MEMLFSIFVEELYIPCTSIVPSLVAMEQRKIDSSHPSIPPSLSLPNPPLISYREYQSVRLPLPPRSLLVAPSPSSSTSSFVLFSYDGKVTRFSLPLSHTDLDAMRLMEGSLGKNQGKQQHRSMGPECLYTHC